MDLRKIARTISVVLAAVFLVWSIPAPASASIAAKVTASSAKVYRKASTKAKSRKVPKNLKVSITAVSGDWAKVSFNGGSAYMKMKNLSPTNKVKGYAKRAVTVYNSAGKRKGSLSKGDGVYVLGTVSGYYCVMSGSGAVGYVKSGTLSRKKPTVTKVKKVVVLTKVDKALLVARQLLGRPYSMSGSAPYSFNCSSFVQYCMGKAGYSMNGTAAAQSVDGRYAKVSSVSSLRKGDILFFDTTGDGRVDHSAIYISGGKFVEASRNAGKVQVNTLSSWYKSHFKWARRPS